MSFFECPLCGRSVSLSSWNPSQYEVEFIEKTFRGLGRGKGFEVASVNDIEDTKTLEIIGNRCIEIIEKLIEDEVWSREEVLEAFTVDEED